MKLYSATMVKSIIIFFVLDVVLAYFLSRFVSNPDAMTWGAILLSIWAVQCVVWVKRTIYIAINSFVLKSSLAEFYRRRFIEAGLPAPAAFDSDARSYLFSVADDKTKTDEIRFAAFGLACEMLLITQFKGLAAGFAVNTAANEALNRLK